MAKNAVVGKAHAYPARRFSFAYTTLAVKLSANNVERLTHIYRGEEWPSSDGIKRKL